MAATTRIPVDPEERHATVLVDHVRTAAAASVTDTSFHVKEDRRDETLQDLEERIRRLAVHHLNDLGIPVSAQRPYTVEATPEVAFLIRTAGIVFRNLPRAYKGIRGWWHSRQDKTISTHYKTATITLNLRRSWPDDILAAVAGLPLLERKIREVFPGIKVHILLTWTAASLDDAGAVVTEDGIAVVTSGCVQGSAIVKLLKKLNSPKSGGLNQSLVVVSGRRLKSLYLNWIWVLPPDHDWAAKQNHLDPRYSAKSAK